MLFRNKKENDLNEGKYMGIGGHIENDETPTDAVIREVKEETGLDLLSVKERGYILFINDDYKEEILEIPQHMLGSGEYFALRAEGDSMIDAGISDGDILIIKMQNYAENGQIVVARIGQNVTLKRIFMLDDEKKIKLCPENKLYKEIITDECDIMGVATKIIKDVEET